MDKISHNEYKKIREYVRILYANYMNWVSDYRENDYRIYNQNETCAIRNMACTKIWNEISSKTFVIEQEVPVGKGGRPIIYEIVCSISKLLENFLLLFRGWWPKNLKISTQKLIGLCLVIDVSRNYFQAYRERCKICLGLRQDCIPYIPWWRRLATNYIL